MRTMCMFVVFLNALAVVCCAANIYVPADYPTIQAAVDAAVNGDTVIVSDGVYTGEGNRDIDIGPKAITIRSQNGPENCVIDCEGSFQDNHRAFYSMSPGPGHITIRDFKIQNGNMSGMTEELYGGAIHSSQAVQFMIQNCIFINNYSTHGGAIYIGTNSWASVVSCLFVQNEAVSGGGIRGEVGSHSEVIDCEFQGNSALAGGGICCFPISSGMTISRCNFIGGSAEFGGGVALTAVDGSFADADLLDKGQREPGIYFIDECTFVENDAQNGGAIASYFSNPGISRCLIHLNSAIYNGGGILTDCSHAEIKNNLILGNSAGDKGGAVHIRGPHGSTVMEVCTLVENSAETGGCISLESSQVSTMTNNILFQNSAPTGNEIALYNGFTYSELGVDYSNIPGGMSDIFVEMGSTLIFGYNNLDVDPLFTPGPLGSYYLSNIAAGQTETSLCVDAGYEISSQSCFNAPTEQNCMDEFTTATDQVLDTGLVDLGYHYPTVPCEHDCDPNQDGEITAGDASMTFQIALGSIPSTYTERCSADYTQDGMITAMDAQLIFMVALGMCECGDPV